MGTQKNRLNETVLLSTQNICLLLLVRKYLQFNAEFFCLSKPVTLLIRATPHSNIRVSGESDGLSFEKGFIRICANDLSVGNL